MTAPRDLDRLIRAYLEDGPSELPDRSFDAVRDHIDHTRQRVAFGPWRSFKMPNIARVGLVAAAVVIATVVGFRLWPEQGGIGGPAIPTIPSTPMATPTPAPTWTSVPSGQTVALPQSGALPAGTYYRFEGGGARPTIRVTFSVPDGWTTEENSFMYKDKGQPTEVMFTTWIVTHIFTDACRWSEDSLVEIGATPDDLITSLMDQKGRTEAAGEWPWEGTIAGLPAVGVELEVPAEFDPSTCRVSTLRYWPDPGPNFAGGLCCNPPGNKDFIYAVDVDGQTIAVIARRYPGSSAQNVAELDAIIQSLRLE